MFQYIFLQMGGEMTPFFNIALMVGMLGVFYFLLFRPQMKRQKEVQAFQTGLKAGDQVVTSGGIYGKITEINDEFIMMDIARGTQIKVARSAVNLELSKEISAK